jgi:hypothetical protein
MSGRMSATPLPRSVRQARGRLARTLILLTVPTHRSNKQGVYSPKGHWSEVLTHRVPLFAPDPLFFLSASCCSSTNMWARYLLAACKSSNTWCDWGRALLHGQYGRRATQFPPTSRARGRTCSSTAFLLTTRVSRRDGGIRATGYVCGLRLMEFSNFIRYG